MARDEVDSNTFFSLLLAPRFFSFSIMSIAATAAMFATFYGPERVVLVLFF